MEPKRSVDDRKKAAYCTELIELNIYATIYLFDY